MRGHIVVHAGPGGTRHVETERQAGIDSSGTGEGEETGGGPVLAGGRAAGEDGNARSKPLVAGDEIAVVHEGPQIALREVGA